jgi:hypothetical protein
MMRLASSLLIAVLLITNVKDTALGNQVVTNAAEIEFECTVAVTQVD